MALLTKYVDKDTAATGGNGDIGDKWKYLWEATAAIKADAGTNQYKVYVKASQSYGTDGTSPNPAESDDAGHDGAGGDAGAIIYLDQISPGITTPNVFEGFGATPGDGGIVTLDCAYDGAAELANGIWGDSGGNYYTVFKNFDVVNADDIGIEVTSSDNITFKNVRVTLSDSFGLLGDNFLSFENCVFDNNGDDGAAIGTTCVCVSCISRNNTNNGIQGEQVIFYNVLAYDNGNMEQLLATDRSWFFACTVDANDGNSSECIRCSGGSRPIHVVNCIVVDAATGILNASDLGDLVISRNNLFNGNTDDASAFQTEYDGGDGAPSTGDGVGDLGHVTGVPGFTGTYVPGANAQGAMLDAHFTNAFWASFDGAANPPFT